MTNKTIIITAGTSSRSQSLSREYPNCEVIFADSLPVPSPLLSSGKFVQLPAASAPHFIHELLKLCLDKGADLLVLRSEEEVQALSGQELLFEEYNIEVLC